MLAAQPVVRYCHLLGLLRSRFHSCEDRVGATWHRANLREVRVTTETEAFEWVPLHHMPLPWVWVSNLCTTCSVQCVYQAREAED